MSQCVSPGRHLHNRQMLMFVYAVISSILAHELTSRPLTAVAEGGSTGAHTNTLLYCCSHLPLLLCPSVQKTMAPSKPMFTAGMGREEAREWVERPERAGGQGRGQKDEDADVKSAQRRCSESSGKTSLSWK